MAVSDTETRELGSTHPERMWPLDFSLVVLSGLVLYLVFAKLQFDDARLLYSGRFYLIAVPLIALGMAVILRGFASRYVQRSAQIGFLFSVTVHLLLLIIAFQWVIFQHYYPESVSGVKPERSPVRRTVPEYVFRNESESEVQPDWSKPVDAEAASRILPEQTREPVPSAKAGRRLELPQIREPETDNPQLFALDRATPSESFPKPADTPSQLSRRAARQESSPPAASRPAAPEVSPAADPVTATPAERAASISRRAEIASARPSTANDEAPMPEPSPQRPPLERQRFAEAPRVAEPPSARATLSRPSSRDAAPAGSAPTVPSVAIASEDRTAPRTLAPADLSLSREGKARGVLPAMPQEPTEEPGAPADDPLAEPRRATASYRRRWRELDREVPDIVSTPSTSETQRSPRVAEFNPAGPPDPTEEITAANPPAAPSTELTDRLAMNDLQRRPRERSGSGAVPSALDAPPELAVTAPLNETVGTGRRETDEIGILPSTEEPRIASLDLSRQRRQRRALGGPASPVGSEITAVESFNRRVMRTEGGAAPAPAGMVGPATEEAIELGLVYLAEQQHEDGSWSLAGHGDEVMLHSDTAATGLAILAFQGAGYTHRQHQYAGNVARGLQFLIDHQKSNGDLYIPQDPLSDRNAALYSHGIAALAMCEAYGMTQDPELQEPAQLAINFIAATQHRELGGWRYTPQVSSDTSVSGWMMMALKSGELSGLSVASRTYAGVEEWLDSAQAGPLRPDRYRYNPYAPDTAAQRHGRVPTPTMTSVGMLMRMYLGWSREQDAMQSAAEYLLDYPPRNGTPTSPQRDTYYWYYATQVMFHMGGEYWRQWNQSLNPVLLETQIKRGPNAGSWDPLEPVPDRWSRHAGRLYLTTMNLLNLEVYYRHLPIYEDSAE